MRPNQNWIYTKQGDHWYVLSSGILRLEEAPAPAPAPSRRERFIRWLKKLLRR